LGDSSKTFVRVWDLRPLSLGSFLTLFLKFRNVIANLKKTIITPEFRGMGQGMVPDPVGVGPEHEEMF